MNNSYYLWYIPNDPKIPDFVAYNSKADPEEIITVTVGGECHDYPATVFVSAETALEVVETFIK
jgi:hypothetical protein